MSSSTKLYVSSVGMITSVGADAPMTFASVRAGINRYQESPFHNRKYVPMKIASVPEGAFEYPEPPEDTPLAKQSRYRRMLGLAAPALTEAFEAYSLETPLALFLAGPEFYPTNQTGIDARFISHLVDLAGVNIDPVQSRIIATGKPGGIQAVELAFRYLEQTTAEHAMVGGVDSFIDPYVMGCYEAEERASAENIMDSFTPGEGAGFLLLSTEKGLEDLAVKALGSLSYPGVASESGHRYSDLPYKGEGLAKAFSEALKYNSGAFVKTIFSGMNGESLGVKEHGVALIRNNKRIDAAADAEHPVDCFGDIGAALAPVMIGIGVMGIQSGVYKAPGIVYCSSEMETRAACCIGSAA